MKHRSTALLLALALLAGVPASASAGDKAAIEEYAESLPAAESDVHPAAPKKKAPAKPQQSAPQSSAPSQQTPQQAAPEAPSPVSGSSSAGSASKPKTNDKRDTAKNKAKEKSSKTAKQRKDEAAAQKDQEMLDRIATDPNLGAPPTADVKPAAQKTSSDDTKSLAASVFDPGGPLLWLLVGMVALLVFGVARLSRGRAGIDGPAT